MVAREREAKRTDGCVAWCAAVHSPPAMIALTTVASREPSVTGSS